MNIIIATDNNWGFSKSGNIPWDIKEDRLHFARITKNNIVIMGRKTFETIKTPLKNRINIVVSRNIIAMDNVITCDSYKTAMASARAMQEHNESALSIFVIGGLRLYQEALCDVHNLQSIYLTKLNKNYDCDMFLPLSFSSQNCHTFCLHESDEMTITKIIYFSKHYPEQINIGPHVPTSEIQYLALLHDILTNGIKTDTRNGTTFSIFAPKDLRFNLLEGFPLLTTKKMFWRAIVEELIMFINGITDATYLSDKKIHIWDGNTTEEFLKSRNLDYSAGDMGPMYGWNWRHFSAEYINKDTDYSGKGFDQLANLIDMIKNDLKNCNRRLLLTTFDPSKISQSVLPPCHSLPIQFNIQGEFIDCKMTQRSADMFLGVPFNIASTALFLTLIGKVTGFIPRMLTLSFGDAHIYEKHIEPCIEQCKRMPYQFPTINITKTIDTLSDMENIKYEDIRLCGYTSHPAIKAEMMI